MVVNLPKYLNPLTYFRKVERSVARIILSLGVPLHVVSKIGQFSIHFVATSFLEYHLRAKQGYKREPITVNWIFDVIGVDDVVFDIGANVGTYSLLIGKKAELGSGMVLAFEPEARNFSALNKNIELNRLQEKVVPYAIAFGDSERVTSLFLSSTIPGSACHAIDISESEGKKFSPHHKQGVYVLSIDTFCGEIGVPFPNHIKIDVDGAEEGIISGMSSTLSDPRLRSIMIEITHDVSHGNIERVILAHGFHEEARQEWPNKNMANVLYMRHS